MTTLPDKHIEKLNESILATDKTIYELSCYDCSTELTEGTLNELKKWVEGEYLDWKNVEYECDNIYFTLCSDCSRMMS